MIHDKKKKQTMIWMLLLILIPLPLLVILLIGKTSQTPTVPILFGLIALSWMLLTVNLGCKPRWMEKYIGLPNIYFVHGLTAVLVLIIMNIHKALSSLGGLVGFLGEAASFIFTVVLIFSLIYYAGWLTNKFPKIAQIKHWLMKYINHENSKWVHRLMIIATLLVVFHVGLNESVRAIPNLYPAVLMYAGLTYLHYAIFVYRSYFTKANAKILSVKPLDSSIYELTIQSNRSIVEYDSGQFVLLSFPEYSNLKEGHPFSIVSKNEQSNTLTFAIQEDGDFTSCIKKLKINDAVKVSEAFGILPDIINHSDKHAPLVFIIGGVGITPFVTMIENLNQEVYFFYSVKEDKAMIYEENIKLWENKPNFHVYAQNHRFTMEDFKTKVPNIKEAQIIISGPAMMNKDLYNKFVELGLDKNNLYYESFNF